MDMSALLSARQALAGLRDIAGCLVAIRDFNKLSAIQADMNQRILDVQGALLDLQTGYAAQSQQLEQAKARAGELEDAASERDRYTLYEIRRGAFVYRRRDGAQPKEPAHYLCQPCFSTRASNLCSR